MYFKSPIVNKMAEMFIHEKTDVRESSFARRNDGVEQIWSSPVCWSSHSEAYTT